MGVERIKKAALRMAHEPFRIFFPLGALSALIGVGYWPLKVFGIAFIDTPSQVHSYLQIQGFMFAFITGFIATALPRLTETKTVTLGELSLLVVNFLTTVCLILTKNFDKAAVSYLTNLLILIFILANRFRLRKRNPPPSFVFLPFAFISAVFGALCLIEFYWDILGLSLYCYDIGVALSFQGFILFLVIGVGGFLIRSILGWAPPLPVGPSDALAYGSARKLAIFLHILAGAAILAGFFIEAFWSRGVGLGLRAFVISAECMGLIKIHRKPISGKLSAKILQIALWFLVIGYGLATLLPPQYSLAVLHLIFVGGFSATTLAVATRVVLSHCGYSSLLRSGWMPFSVALLLILCAALVRFSADFFPKYFDHHLAYAAFLWLLGLIVWSVFVLSKAVFETWHNKLISGSQR